jgi:hypothetical protein
MNLFTQTHLGHKDCVEVDTAASILHGVKIVQIHNITKKPAKIYVLSLYDFDAM